jgi:MFS family permease
MRHLVIKNPLFALVYLSSFLYSFHYALPAYIESSFIAQFISNTKIVGYTFSIAAIFTVLLTFLYPHLLKRFGNYRLTLTMIGLEILALLALAFFSNPILVIGFFIAHQTLANIIFLNLDSFVERFSDDAVTGSIRTVFMTVLNIAVAVAPFIAGLMLTDHDFWKIYLAAAAIMSIGFFVIAKNFKDYVDPHYLAHPFRHTLKIVAESHDLHSIIFTHFLLSFFYTWMVIYLPIYLNTHMGISMNNILGIIIPIALLPFVFFEIYLGKLADKKLGEKEILTAGFILMALSTAGLSFITTSSVIVWAIALFTTRTGASMVEAMTESYFYKQVTAEDAHLITFMRTVRATAYIIGPLLGSLVLSFFDFHYLFLALGIILLAALPYSLTIKDTR